MTNDKQSPADHDLEELMAEVPEAFAARFADCNSSATCNESACSGHSVVIACRNNGCDEVSWVATGRGFHQQ